MTRQCSCSGRLAYPECLASSAVRGVAAFQDSCSTCGPVSGGGCCSEQAHEDSAHPGEAPGLQQCRRSAPPAAVPCLKSLAAFLTDRGFAQKEVFRTLPVCSSSPTHRPRSFLSSSSLQPVASVTGQGMRVEALALRAGGSTVGPVPHTVGLGIATRCLQGWWQHCWTLGEP